MNAYDMLAAHYDAVFPTDGELVAFVGGLFEPDGGRLVDAGCATGGLVRALCARGFSVTGIDASRGMIERAQKNCAAFPAAASFRQMDVSAIASLGRAHGVLCFGNTVPHLATEQKVCDFFSAVYEMLDDGGIFTFELLNYEKILKERAIDFRIIETENLIFRRAYRFLPDGGILFDLSLTDTSDGTEYKGTTPLLPLRKSFLHAAAARAGFRRIETYADYRGSPSSGTEFATVYVCRRSALP